MKKNGITSGDFLVCQNMSCSELIIGLYLVVKKGGSERKSLACIFVLCLSATCNRQDTEERQQRMKTDSFTEMLRWLIDWILCDREIREVILACAAGP